MIEQPIVSHKVARVALLLGITDCKGPVQVAQTLAARLHHEWRSETELLAFLKKWSASPPINLDIALEQAAITVQKPVSTTTKIKASSTITKEQRLASKSAKVEKKRIKKMLRAEIKKSTPEISNSTQPRNTKNKSQSKVKTTSVLSTKPIVLASKTFTPDFIKSNDFLKTYEWRTVRMQVLAHYGAKCMCCGAAPETGAVINVDHIKPRKTHPQLALIFDNLQVLCGDCNHGKGNWDTTDWRPTK
jgi:hypothetical protein